MSTCDGNGAGGTTVRPPTEGGVVGVTGLVTVSRAGRVCGRIGCGADCAAAVAPNSVRIENDSAATTRERRNGCIMATPSMNSSTDCSSER